MGILLDNNDISTTTKEINFASNCISKLPQNLRISSDGKRITVYKGSKIYFPNGLDENNKPKFIIKVLEEDITQQMDIKPANSTSILTSVFIDGEDTMFVDNAPQISSKWTVLNDIIPTTNEKNRAYDITNNKMWYRLDVDSWDERTGKMSLPIACISCQDNKIININNVFDGIGFFSNVVFALPETTFLLPNGRDSMGRVISKEIELQEVLINSFGDDSSGGRTHAYKLELFYEEYAHRLYRCYNIAYYEQATIPNEDSHNWIKRWYNTEQNQCYMFDTNTRIWKLVGDCHIGNYTLDTSGNIVQMNIYTVFRPLDSNNRGFIGHQAFPSDNHFPMTLGADGTTYETPYDGWYSLAKARGQSLLYITFQNLSSGLSYTECGNSTGNIYMNFPASKGQKVKINYNYSGATSYFEFVPCNGISIY